MEFEIELELMTLAQVGEVERQGESAGGELRRLDSERVAFGLLWLRYGVVGGAVGTLAVRQAPLIWSCILMRAAKPPDVEA